MVGGILHANQVSVGPPIQICVFATDVSVACVAGLTLTAVHGIGKMSQVVAAGIFVAVVASIETGITRCAHLENQAPRRRSLTVRMFYSKIVEVFSFFARTPIFFDPLCMNALACFLAAACSTPLPYGWGPE